jgi:type I restriction enzyme S subunit
MKNGWENPAIGDVCNVIGGGTPAKNRPEFYRGDVPWATIRDMRGDWLRETEFKISKAGISSSATHLIPAGSVLIATRVGLGKVSRISQDTAINQDIRAIIPQDANQVDQQYLFYWFKSIADLIKSEGKGATVKGVTLLFIKSLRIPLPALKEQQRIVAILDEAFAGIAIVKANAERNLQNARELFDIHIQSIFTQRGEGWVDYTLNQVCIVERGSSPRPIKQYFTTKPDGVNWIKIGDTQEGGKYVDATAQRITSDGAKQSRFVKEGDFILTNSMSFGRPYIMRTTGCIHDGWFVLRLNATLDTDYFYYLLSSPIVQAQFARLASGAVVKNISGDLVKQAILPIPPLDQQQSIVAKVMAFKAETQRLESIYTHKLTALAELKQSLLHQAFSGKLT